MTLAPSPAEEIVALADEVEADLVFLGAELRAFEGEGPFLGHIVEDVLDHAHRTVAIAALPRQWLVRREEQEEPAETAPA